MNGLMMLCAMIYWIWMEINMCMRYVFMLLLSSSSSSSSFFFLIFLCCIFISMDNIYFILGS
jgi:hypothetical protein